MKWIGFIFIIFYSYDLVVGFRTNHLYSIIWNILAIVVTLFYVNWFNTYNFNTEFIKKSCININVTSFLYCIRIIYCLTNIYLNPHPTLERLALAFDLQIIDSITPYKSTINHNRIKNIHQKNEDNSSLN